jgi:hypothetical protein
MEPDNHEVHVNLESRQAALLLERLEALRGELGMLGEDLIQLLRSAGVTPLAEPDSVAEKKSGTA